MRSPMCPHARAPQAALAAGDRDKAEIAKVLFSFGKISTSTTRLHACPCHMGVNGFSELSIS